MPGKNDIYKIIAQDRGGAQDRIRREYLEQLYEYTKRDTVLFFSAFNKPNSQIMNDDIQSLMSALHGLSGNELDLILHSPGGSPEATEQIVKYLRAKYNHIRVIVPQNAMSAATMLACSADEIIMGKHSALGPIDPQITYTTVEGGRFTAPAQSIINEFNQAKEEILTNPQSAPIWIRRIDRLPKGFLGICENTIKLSKVLVKDWLVTYMFSGETEATEKAVEISEWLGNADNHLTHGRPIDFDTLNSMGLKVIRLEDDQELQEKVLSVYHSAMATFDFSLCYKFIENHNGLGAFRVIQQQ